jgi:hypothetical protein
MELKKRESKFYPSIKNKLKFFPRYLFNKKTKILLITLFILLIFFLGNFSGLLISGFFGTFDNPSQRAIGLIQKIGIRHTGFREFFKGVFYENIKIPFNYIKGQFSNPKKIYIDINFKDYQKIEYKRQQVLEKGYLISSAEDYVPANIRYDNKEIKVDLRLKGDQTDHLKGNKWSFRIKTKGDDSLFGMRTFSIQSPKTRKYLNELIFHEALKKQGVIALRYDFIEVIINGKNKGVYALEEHFSKELIEDNDRREGIIIKFNEGFFVSPIQNNLSENIAFFGSNIDTFKVKKTLEDPVKLAQFNNAKNLLESFRRGYLKTHEVFDVDKLAKYFAIVSIIGSEHAANWNNIRFYYNPITSLLEPIGYDGDSGDVNYGIKDKYFPKYLSLTEYKNQSNSPLQENGYYDLFFSDAVFFERYMEELEKVSEKSYLDNLFDELDSKIKKYMAILHRDSPYYHFSKEVFYNNQNYIKEIINPSAKSINVYFKEKDNQNIILSVGNINFLPIEILNVVYNGSIIFGSEQKNIIIQPKESFGPINHKEFRFRIPNNFEWKGEFISNLKVNYKIFGTKTIKEENILPWSYFNEDFSKTDFIRQKSNLSKIFKVDEDTKSIFIQKGDWILSEDTIIPSGFTLFCNEGTTIDLRKGATILSYSNLQFLGDKENLIKIFSSDKTGQGLVVLNAKEKSNLKNVLFEGLSAPSKENWELTGAITFYESPVVFDNIIFSKMNSEDGLNIIRSEFEIKNSRIENCFSDCLDVDFGKGLIESSHFIGCGNDGLDFSGSEVKLKDVKIINSGDKGISVGEKSQINAQDIEINKGNICVASKDSSNLNIDTIKTSNCKYDFAIYQKKLEFGPSSINAIKVTYKENNILEKGSKCSINEKIILENKEKVYEILYGGEK